MSHTSSEGSAEPIYTMCDKNVGKSLRSLDLCCQHISDISPIAQAFSSTLECLTLWECKNILDISAIVQCTRLKNLCLFGARHIKDVSMLRSMPHLEVLDLRRSGVRDVSSLQDMPNLWWIGVDYNSDSKHLCASAWSLKITSSRSICITNSPPTSEYADPPPIRRFHDNDVDDDII